MGLWRRSSRNSLNHQKARPGDNRDDDTGYEKFHTELSEECDSRRWISFFIQVSESESSSHDSAADPGLENTLTQVFSRPLVIIIAVGKTGREIAEELFISFRTVGNHVINILNQTNTINST